MCTYQLCYTLCHGRARSNYSKRFNFLLNWDKNSGSQYLLNLSKTTLDHSLKTPMLKILLSKAKKVTGFQPELEILVLVFSSEVCKISNSLQISESAVCKWLEK